MTSTEPPLAVIASSAVLENLAALIVDREWENLEQSYFYLALFLLSVEITFLR